VAPPPDLRAPRRPRQGRATSTPCSPFFAATHPLEFHRYHARLDPFRSTRPFRRTPTCPLGSERRESILCSAEAPPLRRWVLRRRSPRHFSSEVYPLPRLDKLTQYQALSGPRALSSAVFGHSFLQIYLHLAWLSLELKSSCLVSHGSAVSEAIVTSA